MIRSVSFRWRKASSLPLEGARALSYVAEPLTHPVAGLKGEGEGSRRETGKDFLGQCQISRLENGLRVASQEAYGQYSTVGGESIP